MQVFDPKKLAALLGTKDLWNLVSYLSDGKQENGASLELSWKPTADHLELCLGFHVRKNSVLFKVEAKATVPRDWDQQDEQYTTGHSGQSHSGWTHLDHRKEDHHHHHHRSLLEVLAGCAIEISVQAQLRGMDAVTLA
jgi:hypothetical protein